MITGITIKSDEHKSFFKRALIVFLSNGYRVSAIYGTGAYSATLAGNRHGDKPDGTIGVPEASAVEVAIIDPNGNFVKFAGSGDDVRANTDFVTLTKIIAWADQLPLTAGIA